MKHLISILLSILLLPCTVHAAGFIDGTGQEIAYGQNCQRIVSLMPNVTEIIAYLGYGDRLVGKSSFCNYPDSIVSVDDVGGQVDASLEKIVALQPDIVIAYQGNSLELVDQLKQLGIQVCGLLEARQLEDIASQMKELDLILGPAGRSESAISRKWLDELHSKLQEVHSDKAPTVFFGYPGELVYTAGTESFISDAIAYCGARNIVEIADRWPSVSAEYILAADPDWILTSTSCTEEEDPAQKRSEFLTQLRTDPVWKELRAIREGKLIVVNSDHLLRPGPRILLALDEMLAQLASPVAGQVSNHGAAAAN